MATTEKQIEKALRATGGFISMAAGKLGVTQSAVTQRIQRSDHLQAALEEIQDSHLDLAETRLIGLVKEGNLGALCFYLKCKGKHRGFIERLQVAGKDDGPIETKSTVEAGPGIQKVLQGLGEATTDRTKTDDKGGGKT